MNKNEQEVSDDVPSAVSEALIEELMTSNKITISEATETDVSLKTFKKIDAEIGDELVSVEETASLYGSLSDSPETRRSFRGYVNGEELSSEVARDLFKKLSQTEGIAWKNKMPNIINKRSRP